MGLKKGSYKIPNFEDSKIDKIEIAFTVSAIDDDVVHLVKVSGQRR